MSLRNFKIYRGDDERGELVNYQCEVTEGMVVLDVIHRIQSEEAHDLACRWNCKAGKCGSCSAEINGKPQLMCMTRMEEVFEEMDDETEPILVKPMQAFPLVRDLVTDTSWAYKTDKRIKPINGPEDPDSVSYTQLTLPTKA